MIMQEGFKAFTTELSRAQAVWAQCKETIEEAWEAYTSANVQPGHMIWVIGKSLGRKYRNDNVFCLVKDNDEDSLTVQTLDDQHQPTGEEYEITYDDIDSHADTLQNLVTRISNLPCVGSTVTNLQTAIRNAARAVGAYLRSKLDHFLSNGYAKLAFSVGGSWRGSGMLPHSLRAEGGMGVVIWPSNIAGTITHELCMGKDSNRQSVDIAVNLEIGFDKSCFTGYGMSFAGALQLPHGQETTGGFGLDCDPSTKSCETECIGRLCYPKLDSITIGYGLAITPTLASKWNPIRNAWAFVGVACKEGEFFARGPRNC
jgi:hypothetical protein